jgi:hypothetical protein
MTAISTRGDRLEPERHGGCAEMMKAMDAAIEIEKGRTDHVLRVR